MPLHRCALCCVVKLSISALWREKRIVFEEGEEEEEEEGCVVKQSWTTVYRSLLPDAVVDVLVVERA